MVMLAIAIPVDPRKNTKSKWLYWLVGPMVCTGLFALGLYHPATNPGVSDLIGNFVVGAIFAYLGFGGIYLRKRWPIGRWPGSRS